MKYLLLVFLGLAAVTATVAQSPNPSTPATLKGVLHTGIIATGGETTGTELSYNDQQGHKQKIEVEVPPTIPGANLVKDGAWVSVTGQIVTHHYVERGEVRRIIASEIKPDKAGGK